MTDPLDAIDAGTASTTVTAEGTETITSEAPPQGMVQKVGGVVVERLARLIHPDPRTPDDYLESMVAAAVNHKLGPESEEAKLGQSIALCLDVLTDGDVSNLPPAVHLGWSGLKYRFLKNRNAKKEKQAQAA